ncbi:unnamed protein product [Effrenium voratum]|uniref:Core Histone H2A/H2B/H3 domain-containing protein n=1 Tax=Effrenium voratum TaxID=2562239 RepID=A0AA36NBR6_9DINO|nr:unnamed protein product [Effrenium voratum]
MAPCWIQEIAEVASKAWRFGPGRAAVSVPQSTDEVLSKNATLERQRIFRLQNSTSLQIPKAAFQRLVKDILEQLNEEERKFEVPRYATQEEHAPFRMESQALFALQEAAEHYLTGLMEDGNLCAIHNKRVTLMTKDLEIVSRLRHRKI